MERPKHRRIILLALALLAGGALLLLGRQWTSEPDRIVAHVELQKQQPVAAQTGTVEPAAVKAAGPSEPARAPATRAETPTGFRGRIIDAVTRHPVKEFEVRLINLQQGYARSDQEPLTRTFQSASGRFSWSDVAAGTWRAAVKARGYQQFNIESFQVETGKATREFVMPLLRGLTIAGRVFELSTGAGVANARITFRPSSGDQDYFTRRSTATSKEDGAFELDGVPAGDIVLTASVPDHAPRDVRVVVDEKTPPQEIAVSTGGTIAGMAATATGAPAKASIYLEGPGWNFSTGTNETGQFSYKHLQPGRYRLSINTGEGRAQLDVVLGQDEIKDGLVVVAEPGRSIRGVVRGVPPDRLERVGMVLHPDSKPGPINARVDKQGAYALTGVPPGHAVIYVYGGGVSFQKAVDMPAEQDVTLDIVFPTGARLSGRVTQDGKPAARKNVWIGPADRKNDLLYRASTSEDGEYEIEGLAPGDYRLRADEDISRPITIAGDAVLNIDIPSVQLSARVVEDGGSVPIVGATVYVRGSAPETARVRSDKQTDDFGQFSLTGIEPGEIVLEIYKPGYEMHREKITYSSPVTNRTIALRKSAGVEVRVKTGSRRFPIGFTITQTFASPDYVVDIWVPLDGDRVGRVPSALAGTTFQIGRFSGEPLTFEDWDGQPFELP